MAGFAFPPQTFLAADSAGRIAKVIAARVPARDPANGFDIVASPAQSAADWAQRWTGADLPARADPPEGFFTSANDRPAPDGARPFGGVFPQDERIRRLTALVGGVARPDLDDLAHIQLDVVSRVALAVVDALRHDLAALPATGPGEGAARAMLGWDGAYDAAAPAPAVFETLLTALAPEVYRRLGRPGDEALHERLGRLAPFLAEDFARLSPQDRRAALASALTAAGRVAEHGTVWGDLHRLRIGHVLAAVPVLGSRYVLDTVPVSGGRETVLKTAHPTTDQPHLTMFGAQARHLSDMADPDANRFVLLGGQDGWIGSTSFSDQAAPFLAGQAINVPLTPAAVARAFPQAMRLEPGAP
jgi:penicillin amidase